MGGRMHRAVVLLAGLLLCLAAAAVVLPPLVAPDRLALAPAPAARSAHTAAGAQRRLEPVSLLNGLGDPMTAIAASGRSGLLIAGVVAIGGAVFALARGVFRGNAASDPHRRRSRTGRDEAPQPGMARPFAPARPTAAVLPGGAVHAQAEGNPAGTAPELRTVPFTGSAPQKFGNAGRAAVSVADEAASTRPMVDWLRSEAGDRRAAAVLCAVDDALSAGGWRSRAAGAATQPDARQPEVRVTLALHPAERNIAAAVAERVTAMHPTWRATANDGHVSIEPGEIGDASRALLLPALQFDDAGTWTQYVYTTASLGLAITGGGAVDTLHGVLADLVCMYPPANLAVTVFDRAAAGLYRAAPQWVEPPDSSAATIDRLATGIAAEPPAPMLRPLLLAAFAPDDELLRALLGLQRRLSLLRAPPCALLVAAEQPSAQFRSLAAVLPTLSLHGAAELRLAEQRSAGQPPHFGAGDVGELLRWLPRFGASPPPCIWDTIASSDP